MEFNVTLAIIIATAALSLLAMNNKNLFSKLVYSPYQVIHRKEYYRLFTHAMLHSGWTHLFVNMYVLYIFGRTVEHFINYYKDGSGGFHYLLLYIGGVIFATLPGLKKHRDNPLYTSVGASGAVAAVLFSCIAFDPIMSIYIMFIPIPIPAIIFGVLYLLYEAYMDKHSSDYVAHDAHYFGAIFGLLFTFITLPDSFLNFFSQIMGYFS